MIDRQSGRTVDREFLSFVFIVRYRCDQAAVFSEHLQAVVPASATIR